MNYFTIVFFVLYFCFVKISAESSTLPPLFPRSNNSSAGSQLYCLGGENENGKKLFSVSKLNPTTSQWESVTDMSIQKYVFGATAIGKKIYVCGGYGVDERLNLLEVYDCENNTWTELAPMPNARDDIGMTTLNGNIYVAGGYYSTRYSSVSKYTPETNTWAEVKPMNEARVDHELITLRDAIYVIGGKNTKTVERYSPLIDKWTYIEPTNHTHVFPGVTSHQNKIYVLSGEGFEVFHPESEIWQDLPSLDIGKGVQLVSINDKLLAVGAGKDTASKAVYEFDTTNNSWIRQPDMDVARWLHRAVVVNF